MKVGNLQAARLVLEAGGIVQVRPRGHSMEPKIKDGALVTIEPLPATQLAQPSPEDKPWEPPPVMPFKLEKGMVVLAKVHGQLYLHLVTATRRGRVQISNNKGHVNGWASKVFGVVTKVEP